MKGLSRMLAIGIVVVITCLAVAGSIALSGETTVREEGTWSDATDVLAGKAAEQAGREARDPYINTEQGNMLVFFFCLGGVAGGSIIGYNWRKLIAEKAKGR